MQSRSRRHASVIFLSYPCAATETSIAAWAASHAYRRKADEIGTSLESAPIGPPQCRQFLPPAGPAPREGPGRQPGWSLRRDRTHHAAAADIGGNHFCPGDGRQTSYPSDGGIDRAPATPWLRPAEQGRQQKKTNQHNHKQNEQQQQKQLVLAFQGRQGLVGLLIFVNVEDARQG